VSLVDLDSDFADRRAIKEYVLRILRGRAAFRNSGVRAMRVAAAVAKDAGDATGWVTAGEVRVDVGASIRDVLRRDDGTIAVATGYGIVLLTVSRQGDGRWTTSTA
jgi:hypothetical protein